MAAKYLHSLADENPDLQKQIGCMKGVFQIFNRHHIVSRRRVFSHSLKGSDMGVLLLNNGTPQRESSLTGHRHLTVEKHRLSTESSNDSNTSRAMTRQNLDLRDVVKDSMHREARGLSHNTVTENDSNNWYHDDPRELSRSKSCQFRDRIPPVCKDYPRYSYDGRETDSRTTKLKQMKELPRLSLDSRERSIPIKPSIKPSNLISNHLRNPKNDRAVDADKDMSQTRSSGVVAKLMGLETFPSLKSRDDGVSINKTTNSTRSSMKEPISPSRKIPDLRSISRVTIEPAPWKQRDGARVIRSSMDSTHNHVSTVYGDVDKRLKNLEFAESGKDLRALKQVLEAMQAVEARKDVTNSEPDVSRGHESHIVIMKPATLVKKGLTNDKTGKDMSTESTRGERRSRPSVPVTDSSKPRKHPNKQRSESRSTNGRKKTSNLHKVDDQNKETRMLSECSEESNSRQSSSSTPEKTALLVKTGEPITPEYPSPVSVLDDSVCVESSPSPVKRTSVTKKDDATEKVVKNQHEATNVIQSSPMISTVKFQTNYEKLKKVEDLVKKLKNLNTSHNESHTDYIASLCENTNPNDRYISEVLLASGLLLRDLQSFNPHPSGHPINPELFLVLEHTKYGNLQHEKFHRKLVFDAVNEILVGKLSSVSGMIKQNPRKLLRELCLEIERLQVHGKQDGCGVGNEDDDYGDGDDLKSILCEDVLKRSGNWTGLYGEGSMIAMEVERLILLDLVDEVVRCC